MATITGTFKDPLGVALAGYVDFVPSSDLKNVGGVLVSGTQVRSLLTAGVLSVVLAAGNYFVRVPDSTQFIILVPDSSGSFDIWSLAQTAFSPLPDVDIGLPAGGAAGQVLVKDTSSDYDVSWVTIAGAGGAATSLTLTCPEDLSTHSIEVRLVQGQYVLYIVP